MEIDNVHHAVRLFEPLLRLLLPATGRHRIADEPMVAAPPPRWVPPRHSEPLRGEDSALVRPYLVVYERQEREQERERLRRMRDVEVVA
ncbi:hypothetical protein AB0C96_01040 [Streptomyces sp. NPDC048506]|uniref:hypothetical protein n=1 Tax=Streptomyces sp. NPDC048506 TaxID=3155028 RepID=UPI00341A134A